jgi:hypothetical protein
VEAGKGILLKKALWIMVVCGLLTIVSVALYAKEIRIEGLGTISLVKDPTTGKIAHHDKVVLKTSGCATAESIVFESEGRSIVSMTASDLDGDGISEVLLTMDPGGTGGFMEFALLASFTGSLKMVGEELTPFKKGVASFRDVDKEGNPDIVITFIECEPGKSKPVKKTSVFKYSGGKLMEIRDERSQ